MHIYIRRSGLGGDEALPIEAEPSSTVGAIKAVTARHWRVQNENQVLNFRGQPLDDNRPLQDYGVIHGSSLDLFYKEPQQRSGTVHGLGRSTPAPPAVDEALCVCCGKRNKLRGSKKCVACSMRGRSASRGKHRPESGSGEDTGLDTDRRESRYGMSTTPSRSRGTSLIVQPLDIPPPARPTGSQTPRPSTTGGAVTPAPTSARDWNGRRIHKEFNTCTVCGQYAKGKAYSDGFRCKECGKSSGRRSSSRRGLGRSRSASGLKDEGRRQSGGMVASNDADLNGSNGNGAVTPREDGTSSLKQCSMCGVVCGTRDRGVIAMYGGIYCKRCASRLSPAHMPAARPLDQAKTPTISGATNPLEGGRSTVPLRSRPQTTYRLPVERITPGGPQAPTVMVPSVHDSTGPPARAATSMHAGSAPPTILPATSSPLTTGRSTTQLTSPRPHQRVVDASKDLHALDCESPEMRGYSTMSPPLRPPSPPAEVLMRSLGPQAPSVASTSSSQGRTLSSHQSRPSTHLPSAPTAYSQQSPAPAAPTIAPPVSSASTYNTQRGGGTTTSSGGAGATAIAYPPPAPYQHLQLAAGGVPQNEASHDGWGSDHDTLMRAYHDFSYNMRHGAGYDGWRRVMAQLGTAMNPARTTLQNTGGGTCFFKAVSQFRHGGDESYWRDYREKAMTFFVQCAFGPSHSYTNMPSIGTELLPDFANSPVFFEWSIIQEREALTLDRLHIWNYIAQTGDCESDHGLAAKLVAETENLQIAIWYSNDVGTVVALEGIRSPENRPPDHSGPIKDGTNGLAAELEILFHSGHYELIIPSRAPDSAAMIEMSRSRMMNPIIQTPRLAPSNRPVHIPADPVSRIQFLLSPVPTEVGTVVCRLVRVRNSGNVSFVLYTDSRDGRSIAIARVLRRSNGQSPGVTHVIAAADDDTMIAAQLHLARRSVVQQVSSDGPITRTITDFNITDNPSVPRGSGGPAGGGYDTAVAPSQTLLGSICYIRGYPIPRLQAKLHKGSATYHLTNADPDYHALVKSWTLDLGSKLSRDLSNIQLQYKSATGPTGVLAFGPSLQGVNSFVLDFSYPFSPATAVAFMLPWFDIVEPALPQTHSAPGPSSASTYLPAQQQRAHGPATHIPSTSLSQSGPSTYMPTSSHTPSAAHSGQGRQPPFSSMYTPRPPPAQPAQSSYQK